MRLLHIVCRIHLVIHRQIQNLFANWENLEGKLFLSVLTPQQLMNPFETEPGGRGRNWWVLLVLRNCFWISIQRQGERVPLGVRERGCQGLLFINWPGTWVTFVPHCASARQGVAKWETKTPIEYSWPLCPGGELRNVAPPLAQFS